MPRKWTVFFARSDWLLELAMSEAAVTFLPIGQKKIRLGKAIRLCGVCTITVIYLMIIVGEQW